MNLSQLSFTSNYHQRVAETNSLLCVGLDPTIHHVPPSLRNGHGDVASIEQYLKTVIEIAAPRVPVIKPQFAYYARLGTDGLNMLRRIIKFAHRVGLLVILDAKRSDIGETMEAYGDELFGFYEADAATWVPYMGQTVRPAWLPWLDKGKAAIAMIRTSNPEAAQIQDAKKEGDPALYEFMAEMIKLWNAETVAETSGKGTIGGVVGATVPAQAKRCRAIAGDDVFFLIPGYGAQGAGATEAVSGIVNNQNILMGTVNSSRGITLNSWYHKKTDSPRPGDPFELIQQAIDNANAELNAAVEQQYGVPLSQTLPAIVRV